MRLLVSVAIFVVLGTSSVLSRSMPEGSSSGMELTKTTKGTRVMADSVVNAQAYLVNQGGVYPAKLEGNVYGNLTVLYFAGHDPRKKKKVPLFACRCCCGNEVVVPPFALKHGNTKSCGCIRGTPVGAKRELHGMNEVPEYDIWSAMKARCNNPTHKDYLDYGGRGISVHEEWELSFSTFIQDMGRRPSLKHTLERRNVDGDYCPENCFWLPWSEQNFNRRDTVKVIHNGSEESVAKLARKYGMTPQTLKGRLKNNWPLDVALTEPVRPKTHA